MILSLTSIFAVPALATDSLVSLTSLRAGQQARIHSVRGRQEHVDRLYEFGLYHGSWVEMFRPGNPCILRMAGNKVCLRADDMLDVLVEPLPGPC
jgi:Fe2+ transport system protein FeoA